MLWQTWWGFDQGVARLSNPQIWSAFDQINFSSRIDRFTAAERLSAQSRQAKDRGGKG
jgi:hypothetical protein